MPIYFQQRIALPTLVLTFLMEEAGFREIKEVTFAKGLLKEMDLPERQAESLYLTAIKS